MWAVTAWIHSFGHRWLLIWLKDVFNVLIENRGSASASACTSIEKGQQAGIGLDQIRASLGIGRWRRC
jgi:hypothetical protein